MAVIPSNECFVCRRGDLADIVSIVRHVPEWEDPYGMMSEGVGHLPKLDHIVVVEVGGVPAGFRAGYACAPGAFRCFLAAVVPAFRRQGIARMMYDEQKVWLLERGFQEIRTYTRASNAAMMHILTLRGYERLMHIELSSRKPGDWVDFVKRLPVAVSRRDLGGLAETGVRPFSGAGEG